MNKYGLLVILFLFTGQVSAEMKGKVDHVLNSGYSLDLFSITLKAGWAGSGCGANSNTQTPVGGVLLPSNNVQYESYERNISMALAAALSGATVTLHTHAGTCNVYAITVFNDQ